MTSRYYWPPTAANKREQLCGDRKDLLSLLHKVSPVFVSWLQEQWERRDNKRTPFPRGSLVPCDHSHSPLTLLASCFQRVWEQNILSKHPGGLLDKQCVKDSVPSSRRLPPTCVAGHREIKHTELCGKSQEERLASDLCVCRLL